jgi:hypothetical protein
MGDGPGAGGAGGIHGTRAGGEREGEDDRGFEGVVELSENVLKTLVI